MSKKTKLALLIGAVAAVISAVVVVIVFWDRLMEKFPCCKAAVEFDPDEEELIDEDLADYADMDPE